MPHRPFMLSWGAVTIATMFVWDETSFYVMRFLLGITEADSHSGTHRQPLVGTADQRRPRGDRWRSARRRYPGARLEGEELMHPPDPRPRPQAGCSDEKPGEVGSGGPPPQRLALEEAARG